MNNETPHNPLEGKRADLVFDIKETVNDKISIIIVHKDAPDYLNICLQSIIINSIDNSFEIIVVDNNSALEGQQFLNDIEDQVKVVRNTENLYFSQAANKGVEVADKNSSYYIFMHSDVVILNPGWMDLMAGVCESKGCGLLGLELHNYLMMGKKMDFIQEWLMMVSKECWDKIGPWPSQLPQLGNAFIMTSRAANYGFSPQQMRTPLAHHYGIFNLDISDYERFIDQTQIEVPKLLRDLQARSVGN